MSDTLKREVRNFPAMPKTRVNILFRPGKSVYLHKIQRFRACGERAFARLDSARRSHWRSTCNSAASFMGSAIAVSSREQSIRLSTWALAGALTALIALLYADVIGDLATEWWKRPESSYGMLIPPFAL